MSSTNDQFSIGKSLYGAVLYKVNGEIVSSDEWFKKMYTSGNRDYTCSVEPPLGANLSQKFQAGINYVYGEA